MKKVLIVFEKDAIRVFDISNQELRGQSYLTLFRERDKENYYVDLVQMQSVLYNLAKEGTMNYAEKIIKNRNHYEYERTQELDIEEL